MEFERFDLESLTADLESLGLESGDTIMVHASMRAVGRLLGGPDLLIDAMQKAVGTQGTLMMYTACDSPYDDIGRNLYTSEEEEYIKEHCPPFDPQTARANRTHGILAEFFRTRAGAISSHQVSSRMTAIGDKAEHLTEHHPFNYGLGLDSPLDKLCRLNGKVLLLGSDHDQVTLLHFAEAIAPIEDKILERFIVPMLVDGERKWLPVEEFNSSTGIRKEWPDNLFAQIVDGFAQTRQCGQGKVGKADSLLMSARDLVDFAVEVMLGLVLK